MVKQKSNNTVSVHSASMGGRTQNGFSKQRRHSQGREKRKPSILMFWGTIYNLQKILKCVGWCWWGICGFVRMASNSLERSSMRLSRNLNTDYI